MGKAILAVLVLGCGALAFGSTQAFALVLGIGRTTHRELAVGRAKVGLLCGVLSVLPRPPRVCPPGMWLPEVIR